MTNPSENITERLRLTEANLLLAHKQLENVEQDRRLLQAQLEACETTLARIQEALTATS